MCTAVSPQNGCYLIDIGTGAGFPGIPLKIVRPDLNITLLDSLGKRVNFLNQVIETRGLNNDMAEIKAVHGRAEEIARMPEFRDQYDLSVSRAVSNLSVLSEYCVPFLKTGGILAAYKSENQLDEVELYRDGIRKLGAEIDKVEQIILKDEQETIRRCFVLIKKEHETPPRYPRKAGIPVKRPLM